MTADRFEVELVARAPLSSRVARLRFTALSPFDWAAGQHRVVVRGQGQELFLPYSIASASDPLKPGQFEIAVAVGAGADVLDRLAIGERLSVIGPSGGFTWQSAPSPAALLVGVGTGIAPLRALIEEELARPSTTPLWLVAGHRAPEDVLFAADFAHLASKHDRFRFLPTLTNGGSDWLGHHGRVQARLSEAVQTLRSLDAYVCGRVDMVTEVVDALLAQGIPAPRIRSEGY